MVRTTMSRLTEHIDDHSFQISALMKRIKELETAGTTQATDLSDDNYSGRANVRWLADRIKKLENENTALSSALHTDREWYGKRIRAMESTTTTLNDTLQKMNSESVKRLRELERITKPDYSKRDESQSSGAMLTNEIGGSLKYIKRSEMEGIADSLKEVNKLIHSLCDKLEAAQQIHGG
jgi:glucan-binding YG repeat protein